MISFPEDESSDDDATVEVGCPMMAYTSTDKSNSNNSDSEEEFDGYESDPDVPEYLFPFFKKEQPNKKAKQSHYTAEIVVEIEDRDGNLVPIRALLDTGTTSSIVLRNFVKKGRAKGYKGKSTLWQTLGGNFKTKRKALIDFKFPELSNSKKVTWICHVDETTNKDTAMYDMILGMDLMTAIGIMVDTEHKVIRWNNLLTPLANKGTLSDRKVNAAVYLMATEPLLQSAPREILDADYSAVDIDDHVDGMSKLAEAEKEQLKTVLHKHSKLFQGGLGTLLNIKPVHLELKEGAKPHCARAFPIPQAYERTTRKELDRLERLGVLKRCTNSEWGAPTFIQPKKTGDVRVLTDFRILNKWIKRSPFPLPKISDMLQKLSGFKYATAIDLSMGYYHIPLDEASQKLCTTVLPWTKYQWCRLPMGICNAPDIFQAVIADLFHDVDFVQAYLDDILITSDGTYEDHLAKLDKVLEILEQAGFRANVRKCFFVQEELEYLGYYLTRKGIQPQAKKVEAIMRLQPPSNVKQLRHFLGMVNFYRDMWRRRSHLLAPLSRLISKKVKWQWGETEQKAFDELKATISKETLLAFPDFNKEFHIYTDASDYQLGAVIMQGNKPLAFYSRKLTDTQKRWTTGEQELVSIVETLKEFRNILLGQKLIVHTDHKNILYGNLTNDRIARWRLLLEEYAPEYRHIAGKDNVVADALSRMDATFDTESAPADLIEDQGSEGEALMCCMSLSGMTRDESCDSDFEAFNAAYEHVFAKTKAESVTEHFPINPKYIAKRQQKDKGFLRDIKQSKKEYGKITVEDAELISHEGKICVPYGLQKRIVAWYHDYLGHPGSTRLEKTIAQTMHWPDLSKDVRKYVKSCHKCQLAKKGRKKYGHLPCKVAEASVPWNRVNIDMIGPWSVHTADGKTHKLTALTMIDPATGWFEIAEVPKIDSKSCADAFDDVWLSRYPRPQHIGYDNGSEFKKIFDDLISTYGLTKHNTTAENPQSNGIVERVHQVLADILRTFELEEGVLDAFEPWRRFLTAAAFAIRSTYHTTLEATPAQLVYGRDMFLPIKFNVDWAELRMKRQAQMSKDNARENSKRVDYKFTIGDKVLLTKPGILNKLATPRDGPYTVEQVHNNGTLDISKGAVLDTINIRRCIPYVEPPQAP